MLNNFIEINGCNHYFLNEKAENRPFFMDDESLIEVDVFTKHPFGTVLKPKNCADTPIRFVKQLDGSFLLFKANEWNKTTNSFYFEKPIIQSNRTMVESKRKDGYCL